MDETAERTMRFGSLAVPVLILTWQPYRAAPPIGRPTGCDRVNAGRTQRQLRTSSSTTSTSQAHRYRWEQRLQRSC